LDQFLLGAREVEQFRVFKDSVASDYARRHRRKYRCERDAHYQDSNNDFKERETALLKNLTLCFIGQLFFGAPRVFDHQLDSDT